MMMALYEMVTLAGDVAEAEAGKPGLRKSRWAEMRTKLLNLSEDEVLRLTFDKRSMAGRAVSAAHYATKGLPLKTRSRVRQRDEKWTVYLWTE
jgi:hypothetical protein